MIDKPRKLYVDTPRWATGIKVDDFIVTIGKKQSNTVYHVVESTPKPRVGSKMVRYHLKVLVSDLLIAMRRDKSQNLIPMTWYPRKKKSKACQDDSDMVF